LRGAVLNKTKGNLIMIKAVLFDLDGTLLNTLDDLTDSVNYMLATSGKSFKTREQIRTYLGDGVTELVKRAFCEPLPDEKLKEYVTLFKGYYEKNITDKTRPYDGVIEMLQSLKRLGYQTAIISNKFDSAVQELARTVFAGLIDAAVGESAAIKPKPASDGIKKALADLKITAAEAVYVGDSDTDILTAKTASLPMIAVSWGFRDKSFLTSIDKSLIIVDTAAELLSAISQFNGVLSALLNL
jgi:phosphoglycolate phosphatase